MQAAQWRVEEGSAASLLFNEAAQRRRAAMAAAAARREQRLLEVEDNEEDNEGEEEEEEEEEDDEGEGEDGEEQWLPGLYDDLTLTGRFEVLRLLCEAQLGENKVRDETVCTALLY